MDLTSQHEFLAKAIVVLSRALIYMCASVGIGGLVWEFMQKRSKIPLQENTSALYKFALGGGILSTLTHFWYFGATLTANALPLREKTPLFDIVFSSVGLTAGLRLCGFAFLYPLKNSKSCYLQILGIFLLAISFGITGHSSTHLIGIYQFIFAVLLSVHIIFASAWFAGILDLFMNFRNAEELSRRSKVFSQMSLLLFTTALLCGLGLALFFVQHNSTFSSPYEKILTAKIYVVCVIVVIATIQGLILLPRLQRIPERTLPFFNRGIQLQLLVACLVFLLTSLLVSESPP